MKRVLLVSGLLILGLGFGSQVWGTNGSQAKHSQIPAAEIEWPDPVPIELPTTDEMIDRFGTGNFTGIELSPDKTRLAAVSGVGLFMFDATTFELIWFVDTPDTPCCLSFNADGTKLALTDSSGTIMLIDSSTGQSIRQFNMKDYATVEAVWSPDGRLIAAKGYLQETLVWEVETGKLVWELPGYTEYSHRLVFSPDSRLLVSSQGGYEYRSDIVVWDMTSGEEIYHEEKSIADHIVFGKYGFPQFLYSGMYGVWTWSQDGLLRVRPFEGESDVETYEIANTQTDEQISTIELPQPRSQAVMGKIFSQNNDYLLGWYSIGDREDHVAVWEVSTGELIHDIPADIWYPFPFQMNQWDGQVFYTVTQISEVDHIVAWDIEQGKPIRMIAGTPAVGSLGWEETALIAGTAYGTFQWDQGMISTPAEYSIPPKTHSPDGKFYVMLEFDRGFITIFDAQTGNALYVIDDPVGDFRDFAWSPTGEFLAIAAAGEIIIWDTADRSVSKRLFGHTDIVSVVDWSEYGLASGSWDGSVKVWDVSTGVVQQTFEMHSGHVSAVSWSSDGALASGSDDGDVIIWEAK